MNVLCLLLVTVTQGLLAHTLPPPMHALLVQMKRGLAGKYMCGHNIILAHAKTVELYRKKYKPTQNGRVSIALDGKWGYPKDPNSKAGETWQAPLHTEGSSKTCYLKWRQAAHQCRWWILLDNY